MSQRITRADSSLILGIGRNSDPAWRTVVEVARTIMCEFSADEGSCITGAPDSDGGEMAPSGNRGIEVAGRV